MADTKIDIAGLDKAVLLAALHNHTRAVGMGVLHDIRRDMTVAEAQQIIDTRRASMGDSHRLLYHFDYVCGRPVKTDLSGDSFDPWLFDRDAGAGQAQRAVNTIRKAVGAEGLVA